MAGYQRKPIRFVASGINVTQPVDSIGEDKYSRLKNVRTNEKIGTIESRKGIARAHANALTAGATTTGVHSIRQLTDNLGVTGSGPTDFHLIAGCGARLHEINLTASTQTDLTAAGDRFSGRPLALVPWRPSSNPRTWMYVGDSLSKAKVGRRDLTGAYTIQNWGILPPRDAPSLAAAAGTRAAGTYYYRYTYRDPVTGAKSNPSPVPPTGGVVGYGVITTVAPNTDVVVTVVASADTTANLVDIFRYGGTQTEYNYIGTVNTAVGLTFTDSMTDANAILNESLQTDYDAPFTTEGLPLSGAGTCAALTTGITSLTRTAGDTFLAGTTNGLSMAPGTIINVNGIDYPLYTRTISDTILYIRGTITSLGAGLDIWRIQVPVLINKPLPYVWGPFDGKFFACGDFFRPGNLYWTNNYNPDSAAAQNTMEICSPSEQLMNGFMYDGKSYVFTSERLFVLYPDFSNPNGFVPMETPCQRGMVYNWAFCVSGGHQGGGYVYFLAKDGIYRTTGGVAESITDNDLYYLFPHDAHDGRDTNGLSAVDLSVSFNPTAAELGKQLFTRLTYYDGFLYFDYVGKDGARHTLVYNERTGGWINDNYTTGLTGTNNGLQCHYGSEGRHQNFLFGGAPDNYVYQFTGNVDYNNTPIACNVRTRSEDFGDPGTYKLLGDILIDADTQNHSIDITPYLNNESTSLASTTLPLFIGRTQRIIDIQGGSGQLIRNISLDFNWSSSGTSSVLYLWIPSFRPKPELSQLRCVDWHEFQEGQDDVFITGIRMWVDTNDENGVAQTKTVQIWADQAFTGQTITVTSAGEQKLEFSWPGFRGKLGRIVPIDGNKWKVFKWEWIYKLEPLLIERWESQATSHTLNGYQHLRDGYIALSSNAVVTVIVSIDGIQQSVNLINPTGGVYKKVYVSFVPLKGKLYQYTMYSNAPFRLYRDDCEIRTKSWGSNETYAIVRPFGGLHHTGTPT